MYFDESDDSSIIWDDHDDQFLMERVISQVIAELTMQVEIQQETPEVVITEEKPADPGKKRRYQNQRAKDLAQSKRTRWNKNKDIRSYFVSTKK